MLHCMRIMEVLTSEVLLGEQWTFKYTAQIKNMVLIEKCQAIEPNIQSSNRTILDPYKIRRMRENYSHTQCQTYKV